MVILHVCSSPWLSSSSIEKSAISRIVLFKDKLQCAYLPPFLELTSEDNISLKFQFLKYDPRVDRYLFVLYNNSKAKVHAQKCEYSEK